MGIDLKLKISDSSLFIGGAFLLMLYLLSNDNGGKKLSAEEENIAKSQIPSDFDKIGLPEEIAHCARQLFMNGHFAQSVFEACKSLEIYMKKNFIS